MNDIECEVIVLCEAWEMIDSMISWSLLNGFNRTESAMLSFNSDDAPRLFYIYLIDFFSDIGARSAGSSLDFPNIEEKSVTGGSTVLHYLRHIAKNPVLLRNGKRLLDAVNCVEIWRDGRFMLKNMYFPDINLEVNLTLSRFDCIYLCGNVSKHSPVRLSKCVKRLHKLINQAGANIDEQQAYLAIRNFSEYFLDNSGVCHYHLNQLSELLNNIRLAIYSGLGRVYIRSYRRVAERHRGLECYEYDIPNEIESQFAETMYWELLNKVRSGPCVSEFTVDDTCWRKY